ncbi:MAG: metallophosphoesterase [Alphaproteobacteria bacterium]|nr:metallophosphoesterase [Alphaproteobacteria bacterium]
MPFIVAFFIVAISVIAILYKTYVGYSNYSLGSRISFLLFLLISMGAPFIIFILKNNTPQDWMLYAIKGLYFIFGFVFVLFAVSFVRDLVWMIVDFIRHTPIEEIKNPPHLGKINLITIIFSLAFCLYGVYEAEKTPQILTHTIASPKIKKPTTVVMISDLHIDIDVSSERVKKIVDVIKSLNPDGIVIAGDTVDNSPEVIFNQMNELKKLSEKAKVYIALGNHEFYSGAMDWTLAFGYMNFNVLGNYGEPLNDTGIFITGIPDLNAAPNGGMRIDVEGALYGAGANDYVILTSHTPKTVKGVNENNVDLILSGHTHGGQIYPFHYFTKRANEGRLAGFYDVNGIKMYVSRGTRYWGPPMRIGAPSEITVFNFIPESKADASNN